MSKLKKSKAMSLFVTDEIYVTVLPDNHHEFLMSTGEVAIGYGSTKYAIRKAFSRNSHELYEGKHYVKGGGHYVQPSC